MKIILGFVAGVLATLTLALTSSVSFLGGLLFVEWLKQQLTAPSKEDK